MTKKLQFGMLAAVLVFSMTVIGCDLDGVENGVTDNGGGESVFDFQAWMEWSIPPWASGNPTLTVVREPSQPGVVMIIQHFEVLR